MEPVRIESVLLAPFFRVKKIHGGEVVVEVRDRLNRKIGVLDETSGFICTRFGTDSFEGVIPIGKSVSVSHKKVNLLLNARRAALRSRV